MARENKRGAKEAIKKAMRDTRKGLKAIYPDGIITDNPRIAAIKISKWLDNSLSTNKIEQAISLVISNEKTFKYASGVSQKSSVREQYVPQGYEDKPRKVYSEKSFDYAFKKQIVGTVVKSADGLYRLQVDDSRYEDFDDLILTFDDNTRNFIGKRVGVKIVSDSRPNALKVGKIDRVFDDEAYPSPIVKRLVEIMYDHEIYMTAPDEILAKMNEEAKHIPDHVSEDDENDIHSIANMKIRYKNFKDLRDVPIITIDPLTCKDMDDAVHVEKTPDGGFVQTIAIAFVEEYVKKGSSIDEWARENGNSYYIGDMVASMLRSELSNGICSLNPNKDRLAMVATVKYDNKGNMVGYEFNPAVVRSRKKTAYEHVDAITGELGSDARLIERIKHSPDILNSVDSLQELEYLIRSQRDASTKFLTRDITYRMNSERTDIASTSADNDTLAHRMIETPMLTYNQLLADYAQKHNIPILYRVEDSIEEEALDKIKAMLEGLGIPFNENVNATDFGELQKEINNAVNYALHKSGNAEPTTEDRLFAQVVSESIIKNLPRARYDAKNTGHFALGFDEYAHSTSPIRRYADLVNQRQITAHMRGEQLPYSEEELNEIAEHLNMCERKADEAEREAQAALEAFYIEKLLKEGQKIEGVGFVSHVEDGYIVVEHEYGSVRIDMPKGPNDELMVNGNIAYKVGAKVDIQVTGANPNTGVVYGTRIYTKEGKEKDFISEDTMDDEDIMCK